MSDHSTQATPLPSQAPAYRFLGGGAVLIVIALLSTFLFPNLVLNAQVYQEPGPNDFFDAEVQSGQSVEVPADMVVTVIPMSIIDGMEMAVESDQSVTGDGSSGGGDMSMGDYTCEVADAEGNPVDFAFNEMMGGEAFESGDGGSFAITCDPGGNLMVTGVASSILNGGSTAGC